MEKIEEKARKYANRKYLQRECPSDFTEEDFTNGYTTRNDEVVKMVEGRIAYLESLEPTYEITIQRNEAYMFLHELTKLKEDKK